MYLYIYKYIYNYTGLRSMKSGVQCESVVRFPRLFEKYPFPILINSAFLRLADVFRAGFVSYFIHTETFCHKLSTKPANYCLHTIFQKLHFSKSYFSETPQEKYDHVIFLQPNSPKKCHKNFVNRFTNKIIMPKNYFEYRPFACAREVIQMP